MSDILRDVLWNRDPVEALAPVLEFRNSLERHIARNGGHRGIDRW